ncbi:GGDEF domain-containing protein [Thalassospira sp. MA62]|nr:GGDEF domain-containing protein [Thalassospira sp. MA62]
MKVTRPGSTTSSMGNRGGKHPSNHYGAQAYGLSGAHSKSVTGNHRIDIHTHAVPETGDEVRFDVGDIANVLGIPSEQMTPAVEQAIGRLIIRVNGLSENLADIKKHQAVLARTEGLDPFTGALNRSIFLQILENEMAIIGADRTVRTILVCEVANIDDLVLRFGYGAKSGIFNYVRRIMSDFIMAPHHLGYLGCNDFAALLYNVDADDLEQRLKAMKRRFADCPFMYDGRILPIKLLYGVYEPHNGDTALTALNAADISVRAQKEMFNAQLDLIPLGI